MSASQVTFCIHCGKEVASGIQSTTACESCDSIQKTKAEMSAAEERPHCPWCDSACARPILYGAPSEALWRACSQLDAVWGGCLIDGHEPRWSCGLCHRNWGASGQSESRYCNLCGHPCSRFWCASCCARNDENSAQISTQALAATRIEAGQEMFATALMLLALLISTGRP